MAGGTFTLGELALRIDARVEGDPAARVGRLGSLPTALPGELTHLSSRAYRQFLPVTRATAVILKDADLPDCPTHAIVAKNPYLAFARLSMLFVDSPAVASGIHASAVVDASARLAES